MTVMCKAPPNQHKKESPASLGRDSKSATRFCRPFCGRFRAGIAKYVAYIARSILILPIGALLALFVAGCDSKLDTSYIDDEYKFITACASCKPCKPGAVPFSCIAEGEKCEPLCPAKNSILSGIEGGFVCHCTSEDDFWIFDQTTKAITYRDQAP